MARTKDLSQVLRREIVSDRKLADEIEAQAFTYNVAEQIYNARVAANLTQAQLAKLAGTQQSVIARMENADYSGHSLTMLRRIAEALEKSLHIEFRGKFTNCEKVTGNSTMTRIQWCPPQRQWNGGISRSIIGATNGN